METSALPQPLVTRPGRLVHSPSIDSTCQSPALRGLASQLSQLSRELVHRSGRTLVLLGLFLLLPVASGFASAQSLINGGAVSGNISFPGEMDTYTFSANAGEGFQLRIVDVNTTSLLPKMSLYNPSGVFVTSGSGNDVGSISRTAGSTGLYSLVVEDGNFNPIETGAYDIHFALAPGANENGALANGGNVSSAIDQGDLDSFTFFGNTGESIVIRINDVNGTSLLPSMSLYNPSGTFVTSGSGNDVGAISRTLNSTGTFTLIVADGNFTPTATGDYDIHFALMPGANEHGTLVNGGKVSEVIDQGDLDTFTFSAVSGESVVIRINDVDGTSLLPAMSLYNPSGTLVTSGSGNDVGAISRTLNSTGVFTLVVADGNFTPTATGAYDIHFALMPGANEHGTLVNGGKVSEVIDQGDLDTFTFSAISGESVVIRINDVDGTSLLPAMSLYNPSGTFVTSGSGNDVGAISRTLNSTGVFTLVVADGNFTPTATGAYDIHFARMPGANEHGTLVNGGKVSEVIDQGDLDTFTFSATSGESIVIRINDVGGTGLLPAMSLYNPSGTFVTSGSGNDVGAISRTLNSTGEFTLVVADGNFTPTGTGAYEIHFVLAPGANEHGTLINGGNVSEVIEQGDLDTFTFFANSGESVVIRISDVGNTSLLPAMSLYNPSGTFVTSGSGSDVGAISRALNSTGVFTLVVADGNFTPTATGAYDVHFVLMPGANEHGPLLNGVPKTDLISQGDLDSYTFAAVSGEVAVVTVTDLTLSTLLPAVSLYGPSGAFITSGSGATTATLSRSITNSGIYTLIVGDGNFSPSATGSYSIVLDGSGASSAANEICPAEFPTDPILIDNGGDPGVGPNIGNAFEPFNVEIDCTNATSPGIYAIVVWSSKQPVGLPTQFGLFYLGGGQLLSTAGTHSQSVESWFPAPTGMVLANDPALVGVTFTVQGFSGGYSPNGRLSSAIRQTIGS